MCLRDSSSISAGVKIFVALPEIPTNSCPLLLQAAADIRSPILKTSENCVSGRSWVHWHGKMLPTFDERLQSGGSRSNIHFKLRRTSCHGSNGLKLLDNQNLVQAVDLSE